MPGPDKTSGYILLHRKLIENPLWLQFPPEWLKTWVGILLLANYRPSRWWDGKQHIDIPAGGFVTSIERLAEHCKVTPKQIRGTLAYLERAGMVARIRAGRYSVLIIENWDTYQKPWGDEGIDEGMEKGEDGAATRAASGQGEGKVRATEEKGNKGIKKNTLGVDPIVMPFAQRIHERHPKNRNCSIAQINRHLTSIIRNHCDRGRELETLEAIDRRHERMCLSIDWQKDGGQYAKGLENWLAPTKYRWQEDEPANGKNGASLFGFDDPEMHKRFM